MPDDQIPDVIERSLPNAVTYDLSTIGSVKITLPETSTWSSGLHWHETHDEYLKVIKGSIKVRLGNTEKIISATPDHQPEVKVNRYEWHEWQRAERNGGEVVVVERTEPDDRDKAVFFWNLNGVILNSPRDLMSGSALLRKLPAKTQDVCIDAWITLNLFVIFGALDNFPVFLNLPGYWKGRSGTISSLLRAIDHLASHLILLVAALMAKPLGVTPVRRKYTPINVYETWWSERSKGGRKNT